LSDVPCGPPVPPSPASPPELDELDDEEEDEDDELDVEPLLDVLELVEPPSSSPLLPLSLLDDPHEELVTVSNRPVETTTPNDTTPRTLIRMGLLTAASQRRTIGVALLPRAASAHSQPVMRVTEVS
jgi:hypothetical protein